MRLRLPLVLIVAAFGAVTARGAPVDLSAPPNPLGASDRFGDLRIIREIGSIDFGQGLVLPVRIDFNSGRNTDSPYLGRGWEMPLLESHVFLHAENQMECLLLCGKTMYLIQDKDDPNKFVTGDGQWTGIVKDNTTTISRPDGWELKYIDGHIRQLRTDTGRILVWDISNGRATDIREQGSPNQLPLTVLATIDGGISGFVVNGKKNGITLDKRPEVESHAGVGNLIGGLDQSLSSWTWPDGKKETYTFAVEQPPSAMNPNLVVTDRTGKKNKYTWDPATDNILTEGFWHYAVGPKDPDNFAILPWIKRTNAGGQSEYYFDDTTTGVTEKIDLNGRHTFTEVFKSLGPLYGKVRKEELQDDQHGGKRTVLATYVYDEAGKLLRQTDEDGLLHVFQVNDKGQRTGERVSLPADPDQLNALYDQEKQMLAALATAQNTRERQDDLYQLGIFYVQKLRDSSKATALLPQLTNRNQAFHLDLALLDLASDLSTPAKKVGLELLESKYPERAKLLQVFINGGPATRLKSTGPNPSFPTPVTPVP